MSVTSPEKAITYIRGFFRHTPNAMALDALNILLKYSTGTRKDGVTPEWFHPVCVMMWLMNFDECLDTIAYRVYCVALLHDTREDHGIMMEAFRAKFQYSPPDNGFQHPEIASEIELLSEKSIERPDKKTPKDYFDALAENEVASLVKGSDRIDNLRTMTRVFPLAKQRQYIEETRTLIIPMIKTARHNFGKRVSVYEAIKYTLNLECDLIEEGLDAKDPTL
jgi:(p)ppGpp synthase/HD superfamily hydrolase